MFISTHNLNYMCHIVKLVEITFSYFKIQKLWNLGFFKNTLIMTTITTVSFQAMLIFFALFTSFFKSKN